MVFPKADFSYIIPEKAGIDSKAIAKTLRTIEKSGKDIHSMLILRGGKIAFEHYFAPYTKDNLHSMFSCSKTFTSMLIGIAQGKGLLKLTDKVLPYFPEVTVKNPCANKESMTIRDLLIMGTGHDRDTYFGGMTEVEDWPDLFFNRDVPYAPGTHFLYNTGATYMLSAILTKVTGKTAMALAQEWIFDKIGIHDVWWETCPRGISKGGTGLHVRPRDMARLGILISNGGKWEDEQIIPQEYVLEAQQKQIDNRDPNDPNQNPDWASGYCYQMWRCCFPAFRADGAGGQFIVMLPDRDLLFVFTSSLGADIGYPLTLIKDILLPGITDGELPEKDDKALMALSKRLSDPAPMNRPAWAWNFDFKCAANKLGIERIALSDALLTIKIAGKTVEVPYAWNKPVLSKQKELTRISPMEDASCTTFALRRNVQTGALRLQRFGTPFGYVLRPFIDGAAVKVEWHDIMGGQTVILKKA